MFMCVKVTHGYFSAKMLGQSLLLSVLGVWCRAPPILLPTLGLWGEASQDSCAPVGFEVLRLVSTKLAVFWVVAPCSLVEVYQRIRGPCCLHHWHCPDDGGSKDLCLGQWGGILRELCSHEVESSVMMSSPNQTGTILPY
jgi:hypothetical protein